MDEEETKSCPNCKRDIPAVNFTIHSVHCARNIRVCPVCKEPVPSAELDEHHQKYHKLLPCKQCGESVCGTDLEDHIRDSCANTVKSCRYCDLELPRREIPAHEGYCGVRTEQCPDCREWVMIKYRQLHVDSNHGFIRLEDDPAPVKKEPPKLNIRPRPTAAAPGTAFGLPNTSASAAKVKTSNHFDAGARAGAASSPAAARPTSIFDDGAPTNFRNDFPRLPPRYLGSSNSGSSASSSSVSPQESSRPISNGVKKRTNDQPQINTNMEVANKVDKDLPISRGAVKKRPAPKPPRSAPADPRRDNAYYSALERLQREERQRKEQNEYNLAHGLPPVLDPAAKLEKLRKMDALQNRETEEHYRDRLRRPAPEAREDEGRRLNDFKVTFYLPPVLDPAAKLEKLRKMDALQNRETEEHYRDRLRRPAPEAREDEGRRLNDFKVTFYLPPVLDPAAKLEKLRKMDALQNRETEEHYRDRLRRPAPEAREDEGRRLNDFKNLKPMSPEQFMARFSELQVRGAGEGQGEGDRFREIKSSLRELRRGLNEVTAPYNNNNAYANNNNDRVGACSPCEELKLPCEFCSVLVPADDLVQHQTGCRPDLAQFWGSAVAAEPPATLSPSPGDPVIPCEFCARSLPVYLITEHQEQCAREVDILSAD